MFIPRDERALAQYEKFVKVTDIFPVKSTGIKTHRDNFVIDFDKESLKRRIRTFLDPSLPDDFVRETFKLKDNRDWKLSKKRRKIQEDKDWEKKIIPCLYRPFDIRWLFYHPDAIDFGREDVMQHMCQDNLALMLPRRLETESFTHVLCTNTAITNHTLCLKEVNYLFPLWLYHKENEAATLSLAHATSRICNLRENLEKSIAKSANSKTKPEAIFYYIYAILYSNLYRKKYTEFLRTDFPRIPFTKDHEFFEQLAALGKRLVDLHLLRSDELDSPIVRFEGSGDGIIKAGKGGLRYDPETERVYINKTQYFEGVPPEVWEYQIGGYQVCHKWLKDRKNRRLSLDEIKTYCRIVTALQKTIESQEEIDKIYALVEETLIDISS